MRHASNRGGLPSGALPKCPPLATAAVQVNLSGEEQSHSAELSQPLISSWVHDKTAVSGCAPLHVILWQ